MTVTGWGPGFDDRGYATVTTAGITVALFGLCAVVGAAASLVIAEHEAGVAADLAAVAGAWAAYRGENACAVAGQVAGLNGASMSGCHTEDADVTVTAVVRGREVAAKAGPV